MKCDDEEKAKKRLCNFLQSLTPIFCALFVMNVLASG